VPAGSEGHIYRRSISNSVATATTTYNSHILKSTTTIDQNQLPSPSTIMSSEGSPEQPSDGLGIDLRTTLVLCVLLLVFTIFGSLCIVHHLHRGRNPRSSRPQAFLLPVLQRLVVAQIPSSASYRLWHIPERCMGKCATLQRTCSVAMNSASIEV
jgi:hypothetical protein